MTANLLLPPEHEIHVWTAVLDGQDELVLAESGTLSPDEQDRASRYRRVRDRRRFMVSRAALRYLLGAYLRTDGGSLRLALGPHGKPRLAHPPNRLCFSTSHSEELAVFAVARDRELGVDVERVRKDVDLGPLARRVLSPSELLAFGRLNPDARPEAFYRSWTRKEASLKALGVGLTVSPDEVDVTGDHARFPTPRLAGLPGLESECSLHDLDVGPAYVATLAVQGELSMPPTMCGRLNSAEATTPSGAG